MPTIKDIQEAFGEDNFYTILNVSVTANKNEIRKAYYRLSLTVHPDRVEKQHLEHATRKFQALGKIYEVLSSDEKRAIYDETGTVDDECSNSHGDDRNWYEYWRILFARVNLKDIEEFETTYKGSDEELNDLRKAYIDFKGDMTSIIDNMMCATVEDDENRFRNIIKEWIKNGTVKAFAAFTRETNAKREKRKLKAEAEALEAEAELKKISRGEEASLAALIQRNQNARAGQADDFFAMMEEKYGGKSRKSSSSKKDEKKKTTSRK